MGKLSLVICSDWGATHTHGTKGIYRSNGWEGYVFKCKLARIMIATEVGFGKKLATRKKCRPSYSEACTRERLSLVEYLKTRNLGNVASVVNVYSDGCQKSGPQTCATVAAELRRWRRRWPRDEMRFVHEPTFSCR